MDRQELLWKQYDLHVGLYKFYLELTLKVNAAFYAISGAVATYTLTHQESNAARIALLIPAVFGVGLAVVAGCGAYLQESTRDELVAIRDSLELQTIPEIKILSWLLCVSVAGFLAVSGGLFWLWCTDVQ
ncbi:hypothetical protein ABQ179_003135 [Xanthomonas dyei]|uniref:hypothetical protein n=1 Tax=Xanthomonas dyei TaxID=743699 RepID=UPI0032E88138